MIKELTKKKMSDGIAEEKNLSGNRRSGGQEAGDGLSGVLRADRAGHCCTDRPGSWLSRRLRGAWGG